MGQAREHGGLAAELLLRFGRCVGVFLDGDDTVVQVAIDPKVDRAHAALAEPFLDSIAPVL